VRLPGRCDAVRGQLRCANMPSQPASGLFACGLPPRLSIQVVSTVIGNHARTRRLLPAGLHLSNQASARVHSSGRVASLLATYTQHIVAVLLEVWRAMPFSLGCDRGRMRNVKLCMGMACRFFSGDHARIDKEEPSTSWVSAMRRALFHRAVFCVVL